MTENQARDFAYTIPLSFGGYSKEEFLQEKTSGNLPISRMVELFHDGIDFVIMDPAMWVMDMRGLLTKHLKDWSTDNFYGLSPDDEGLVAMGRFLKVLETISKDSLGKTVKVANSAFAQALMENSTNIMRSLGSKDTFEEHYGSKGIEFKNPFSDTPSSNPNKPVNNSLLDSLLDN